MTLTNAIRRAGGLLPFADLQHVEVRYPSEVVRTYDLLHATNSPDSNPQIPPGTTIIVHHLTNSIPRHEKPPRQIEPPAPHQQARQMNARRSEGTGEEAVKRDRLRGGEAVK